MGLPHGTVADAIHYKTVDMFGAVGDGETDDAAAIQLAANWICAGSYRKLVFNPGKIYRLAASVSFAFASGIAGCEVDMQGAIKPDSGVGDAFSFSGMVGGTLKLNVIGDGVTEDSDIPDYSLADPDGAQQSFVIDSIRSCIIAVLGYGYAGRVLRTKSTGSIKTSFLDIHIRTGDLTSAATAGRCGQAMYLEGGSDGYGIISKAQTNWDVYGSVLSRLGDISVGYWEAGSGRKNPTVTIKGCGTGHLGTLAIGVSAQEYPCLLIEDDGTTPTSKIHIKRLFGVSGLNTLKIVGTTSANTARKPVTVDSLFSYNTAGDAVLFDNISNITIKESVIDAAASYGVRFTGNCRNIRLADAYFMNLQNPSIYTDADADIGDLDPPSPDSFCILS